MMASLALSAGTTRFGAKFSYCIGCRTSGNRLCVAPSPRTVMLSYFFTVRVFGEEQWKRSSGGDGERQLRCLLNESRFKREGPAWWHLVRVESVGRFPSS